MLRKDKRIRDLKTNHLPCTDQVSNGRKLKTACKRKEVFLDLPIRFLRDSFYRWDRFFITVCCLLVVPGLEMITFKINPFRRGLQAGYMDRLSFFIFCLYWRYQEKYIFSKSKGKRSTDMKGNTVIILCTSDSWWIICISIEPSTNKP